ncbi:M4 family metallopeptidase [Streptosporangium sandarakinum]|uniref:M4 family metallopeptidase n=1 Tax=Streptosporangium nondiastaticum TaxID=35764 RepID=UPI0031F8215E
MKRSIKFTLLTAITGISLISPVTPAVGRAVPAQPPAPSPEDPRTSADRFIQSQPPPLFTAPTDEFHRQEDFVGAGGLHYIPYTRTHDGLPVFGGDFVVVSNNNGGLLSTFIAQRQPLTLDTTPEITPARAAAISRRQITDPHRVSAPRLLVLARGSGRLAYETVVTGRDRSQGFVSTRSSRIPSKMHVFVDAKTGEVIFKDDEVKTEDIVRPSSEAPGTPGAAGTSGTTRTPGTTREPRRATPGDGTGYYNGPVAIGTSKSGTTYSMTDSTRSGVQCGGQNGSAYTKSTDTWGNGSGTSLETACVDGLYAVNAEWDMLRSWLGRNGINGTGGGYPVQVGLDDVNAYWTGEYANFGHTQDGRRQVTPIDVVAHEFGHAIFQNTPGGAIGDNEKGGLNESTGDIYGALTEFYANGKAPYDTPDFSVGEKADLVGGGPIRYMYKPSLISGNPDCYSSSVPGLEVHAGAGVQNHWFYLLAEGTNPTDGQPASPTCNNTTLTGIGIQKAGQIFMSALNRKTDTWTHQLVRKATLQAALELFPGSCAEFNAVKGAWDAVSVPAASGEPTTCTGGGSSGGGGGVSDFSLTLNPQTVSAQPGQRSTVAVTTQTTSGSAQRVTFSASGLPSGATASFDPASVTSGGSSTMTITVPAGVSSGSHKVIVTGDGSGLDRTAALVLTVGAAGGIVFDDTFETSLNWTANPSGTDTATAGRWERGVPQPTSSGQTPLQLTAFAGRNDLVTGRLAGASAGDYDIDGGTTTVRSPEITLPPGKLTLTFSWYLAHLDNATGDDFFQLRVLSGTSSTLVFRRLGSPVGRPGAWQAATIDLSGYAGKPVRLLFEAADNATPSLIEAAVDNVRITRS